MKRLLAYLIIVLGLGLTFSVKANAEEKFCVQEDFVQLFQGKYYCDRSNAMRWLTGYQGVYQIDLTTYEAMKKIAREISNQLGDKKRHLFFDYLAPARKKIYENYKTKITKAEPSQTVEEQVVKTSNKSGIFKYGCRTI